MGRLPIEIGGAIKKGPWTPKEDLKLVSYVQEHGPYNWKYVSNRAGLQRSSKSCRLRWANYLRPGIKRCKFTDEEDMKIINLRDLFGNKWAAIAGYLPGRTDNDIKNYWNTHLKKKLKRPNLSPYKDGWEGSAGSSNVVTTYESEQVSNSSKGVWVQRLHNNVHLAKQALLDAVSLAPTTTTRASITISSPTTPGLGSSQVMGPPPISSPSLMCFKPPYRLDQNVNKKQLLVPANHDHFPTLAATQINQSFIFSSNSYPCSTENIARWLKRWTKESPKSAIANKDISILK